MKKRFIKSCTILSFVFVSTYQVDTQNYSDLLIGTWRIQETGASQTVSKNSYSLSLVFKGDYYEPIEVKSKPHPISRRVEDLGDIYLSFRNSCAQKKSITYWQTEDKNDPLPTRRFG